MCFSLYSSGNLATFLDYITYSYMIDNIILLITGTLHQRPISELVPKCHPLGSFEQMEAIHVAATPAELYSAVLVDTPLGKKLLNALKHVLKSFYMYLKA
jgi:V-type H+-transporting ATPase subunit d